MCLSITSKGINLANKLKEKNGIVLAYKVLAKDGESYTTPYMNTQVKVPGVIHSDRLSAKLRSSEKTFNSVHNGIHLFLSQRSALEERAWQNTQHSDSCHAEIWIAEINPEDIIAIGCFERTTNPTECIVAKKAKLTKRFVRGKK